MGDGFSHVPVVSLLAVVAVAAGSVVAAVQAHPSAPAAGQLKELHVEATSAGMQVTVASCRKTNKQVRPNYLIIAT